jgi:hypothetical protein
MDSTPTNNATLEMYTNIKANMLDMYGTEAVQSLTDETGFVMHWLKQTKPCTLTVKITNKGRMKVAFTKNLAEGITNTTIKEGMEGKTAIQIGTADSSIRSVLVWNRHLERRNPQRLRQDGAGACVPDDGRSLLVFFSRGAVS